MPQQLLDVTALGVAVIAIFTLLAITVQVTRRYGQVLIRLEALERQVPGVTGLSGSRLERNGLRAGTPAPHVDLSDLNGGRVALESFRGRNVLLVFSDPNCPPCDALAPHLTRLERSHRDNGLSLVMVSRGDVEENRRKAVEHGFQFPVLLQRRWEVSKEFGIFATPVGFLIGPDGVISRDVGIGMDEIMALVADPAPIGEGAV
ncbi:MAG: TlpA family protein disulfide reductase [Chloroflexi bacterium]|nr:MAG: TlpA family protein disulfide reductase [Chloroflexota bacterium]